MKHKIRFGIVVLLVVSLSSVIFYSCVKKVVDLSQMGEQQWQPNIAAPLIYSSLTIGDIITKSGAQGNIIVGSDNFCTLIYRGTLFSFLAKDLFILPAQAYTQTFNLNSGQIGTLTGSGSVTVNYTQTINFDSGTSGPSVDSLIYKSGLLTDSIVSDFKQNGSIQVTIPEAKKNGVPFTQTLNINYAGTTPVTTVNNIDLSGYKFDMTYGGTTSNKFDIKYAVTINYNSANPVSSSNTITIVQKSSNLAFDKIFGYIGQQSLVPANQDLDTVALSVFKSFSGSSITLQDPRLKFIFSNSFGVPIRADLSKLDAITSFTEAITGYPTPLPIQSPTINEIGQTKIDSFSLDQTNSNLKVIINKSPSQIIYKIASQSNPLGKVSQNFVIDTSQFKVDMEVQLPLYGTANGFTIMDTIPDFKLNFSDSMVSIQSMLLRTYISNGFPTDVGVQVYITDSLYNKLDSLISPYQILMPSAIVNSTNGIVTSPSVKTTDSSFDKARIAKLMKGTRALIKGTLSTYNNGTIPVKFYSDYKLDVKIGIQCVVNVKIN